jgi:hypothetical protein
LHGITHVELPGLLKTSHWRCLAGLADLQILRSDRHELFLHKTAGRIVRRHTGVAHHDGERLIVGRHQRQGKLPILADTPSLRHSVGKELTAADGQIGGALGRDRFNGIHTGRNFPPVRGRGEARKNRADKDKNGEKNGTWDSHNTCGDVVLPIYHS